MDINQEYLDTLNGPLNQALIEYGQFLGVQFRRDENGNLPRLELKPQKHYSARTQTTRINVGTKAERDVDIEVLYKNIMVGNLVVLVFNRGDGTGDSNTYKLNDLIIPEYLKNEGEKIIPRAKKGVVCEGFLPLFSISPEDNIAMCVAGLDELGLVNKEVTKIGRLGMADSDYARALKGHVGAIPEVYFTVGKSAERQRIGDPHAIYYNRSIPEAVQVVGCLEIVPVNGAYINNPLMEDSKYWSSFIKNKSRQ